MNSVIKINAIMCKHCGEIVMSTSRHDFRTHTCAKMAKASGPEAFIAADGGQAYLRRCGNHEDWEEVSTWGP